jgi:ATPase subunit of ABC transporter with duplicated ATPase domains
LGQLSGGERARVSMLMLLLEENNLLLLDEPTNHLDVDAKEALEEALEDYQGSIIAVSHDRWFLERICNTIWHLPSNGELRVYPGGYNDFLRHTSV